jgi:hypothetical protein
MSNRRFVIQALLTAPWLLAAGCQQKAPGLSKEIIMQKYPMKTYAVGRFLIDLPEKSKFGGIGVRFDGMDIEKSTQRTSNVAVLSKARIASLSSSKPSDNKFIDSFLSSDGKQAIILYTDSPGYKGGGEIESYIAVGSQGLILQTKDGYGEDKKQTAIGFTREVLDLIKPIDDASFAKSFMGDGYLLATADAKYGEQATAVYTLNEKVDIAFTTQVREPSTEPGLIERTQNALKMEELAKTTQILRMTKRSVSTNEGEEVAYKNLKGSPGGGTHNFEWDCKGRNQLGAPAMSLHMELQGDPAQPAIMSDEEALGLWDAILNSIRLRPGAV